VSEDKTLRELLDNSPSMARLSKVASEALTGAPDEVTVTITLRGFGAKRYHFASRLLQAAFGMSVEEAGAYLLRMGAETEIHKMGSLYQKATQGDTEG